MARIRTVKPEFFRSDDVAELPFRARLTWVGLWTQCDDHGRTKDNIKLIKADVWPLDDVSLEDVEDDLATLAAAGRIVRYEVDGVRYLAVVNWHEHQSINRPGRPKYPAPPVPVGAPAPGEPGHCEVCWNAQCGLSEDSLQEGNREGNREGTREPARQCPQHLNHPKPPPCGKCADARRAHEAWQATRRTRLRLAARCPTHPSELADNCRLCRSERIASERAA